MPKHGHPLNRLVPQFPADLCKKLEKNLSVQTAEELLGMAVTQDLVTFAKGLNVAPQILDQGIRIAKDNVDPQFLLEMARPVEDFPTGARLDEPFELPEELARHLHQG
jgi:hypothetical protein